MEVDFICRRLLKAHVLKAQLIIACSKSTIETLEQGNVLKVN